MIPTDTLLETLPPVQRVALAYAQANGRDATLAALALDTRLAMLVRGRSEPLLAQMRLAWWRDRLTEPSENWPAGEPLLSLLRDTGMVNAELVSLVDGWEGLLAEGLGRSEIDAFVTGRTVLFASLAETLGAGGADSDVREAARGWALSDLWMHLSDPREKALVEARVGAGFKRATALPKAMRPLAVLYALGARNWQRRETSRAAGLGTMLVALRAGLLGR